MTTAHPEWLTVSEAARRYGISRRKLARLLDLGVLPWSRLGPDDPQRLIPVAAINALLDANGHPAREDKWTTARRDKGAA